MDIIHKGTYSPPTEARSTSAMESFSSPQQESLQQDLIDVEAHFLAFLVRPPQLEELQQLSTDFLAALTRVRSDFVTQQD